MIRIVQAESDEHFADARSLFEAYAASLDFDLWFQDFAEELVDLRRLYAPPDGCLFLAIFGDQCVGCVASRRLDGHMCEMKRLYVSPRFRNRGIGKRLAEAVIERARDIGYLRMRLDTVPSMERARALYHSLGFREIQPYRLNPIEGAVFMERDLT